jgi:hypothetical protein
LAGKGWGSDPCSPRVPFRQLEGSEEVSAVVLGGALHPWPPLPRFLRGDHLRSWSGGRGRCRGVAGRQRCAQEWGRGGAWWSGTGTACMRPVWVARERSGAWPRPGLVVRGWTTRVQGVGPGRTCWAWPYERRSRDAAGAVQRHPGVRGLARAPAHDAVYFIVTLFKIA